MYSYTPASKNKKALILTFLLFFCAAICLFAGQNLPYRGVWQFIGLGCLVLAIQITSRYLLTAFRYSLSPLDGLDEANDFTVERIQGNHTKVVANVSLYTHVALLPRQPMAELDKKVGKIGRLFNFCPTLFPDGAWVYVFEFNGEQHALLFEPDDEFLRQLRLRIEVKDVGEEEGAR